jgi:glutamate-1-semialdehyde 2,1-aminomutase
MITAKSNRLLEEYGGIVPGGIHSNFRRPIYFREAAGAYLWDLDGNQYLDCVVNNGACILGHGDADVTAAVTEAVKSGITVSMETELSLKVAKQLHQMVPSAEQVRLANTGTEAVMKALMIARAHTCREKIVKIEGTYHGWFDEAQVSVHPDPVAAGDGKTPRPVLSTTGIRQNTLHSVLVIPFNDLEALDRTLEANRGEVAAMLIEPVVFNSGCILPQPGYLDGVRKLTRKHGVVLIFDEVITGFRLAPGGAQEFFGIIPDMSVFAKAIANGYPLSAVVGRKDLMELTRPGGQLAYGGTYNGHHAAVAATIACLEKLKDGKVQKHLAHMTRTLEEKFASAAHSYGLAARLQQCGGEYQVYFGSKKVENYREAYASDRGRYKVFFEEVSLRGMWMSDSYLFHHGVTYAHGDEEVKRMEAAFQAGLSAVKAKS